MVVADLRYRRSFESSLVALYARRGVVEALDLGTGLNPFVCGGVPDYAMHDELFSLQGYTVPVPYSQNPNVAADYVAYSLGRAPASKRRRLSGQTSICMAVASGGG